MWNDKKQQQHFTRLFLLSTAFRQQQLVDSISREKKTQTKEISFFLCGKCKHSFLYYFLLHSWQHCINREDREFKSVSDGLRPLKSLCSVRLHYKFCLHYLVFTFHKPVCLFQRHCRAERLSCQSRLCEAWRLRPVEVHRGRRILQG